jgi:hypothetical protein
LLKNLTLLYIQAQNQILVSLYKKFWFVLFIYLFLTSIDIYQEPSYTVSAASLLINNFGEENGNAFVICGVTCVPIKIKFVIKKASLKSLNLRQVEICMAKCEYKINQTRNLTLQSK